MEERAFCIFCLQYIRCKVVVAVSRGCCLPNIRCCFFCPKSVVIQGYVGKNCLLLGYTLSRVCPAVVVFAKS